MNRIKPLHKKSLLRHHVILVTAVVALVIAGWGAFAIQRTSSGIDSPPTPTDGSNPVDLKPPTKEESAEANAKKAEIVASNPQLSGTSNGDKNLAPKSTVISLNITAATASQVKAYISGVFEDNGTCTATITQGPQVYTKSSAGFKNVSYTQCTPIYWNSPLSSGNWNLTVVYKSPSTETSKTMNVTVQ